MHPLLVGMLGLATLAVALVLLGCVCRPSARRELEAYRRDIDDERHQPT